MCSSKMKYYLRRENKANKKQYMIILRDIKIHANAYAYRQLKNNEKMCFMAFASEQALKKCSWTSSLARVRRFDF